MGRRQVIPWMKAMPLIKGKSVPLTEEDKEEIVMLHNAYRRNATPPAANMRMMQWDEDLAEVAQAYGNLCKMEHGLPDYPEYHSETGQSLYKGQSNLTSRGIWLWYDERRFLDFRSLNCSISECGHYIQLMWAMTYLVGCALSQCGRSVYMFTCHYYPQGYVSGVQPYLVGKPCSLCADEIGGFCLNDMCVTKTLCEANKWPCECNLKCYNCGQLNYESCSCKCTTGWDYLDCSRKCEDSHYLCGKNPGFWEKFHCSISDNLVKNDYCRSMCEACQNMNSSKIQDTCCDGVECPTGYVLDLTERPCSCKLICPGPECYNIPSAAKMVHIIYIRQIIWSVLIFHTFRTYFK